jgi:general secretion pathway protein G
MTGTKKKQNRYGFTMIEMMAVLIILGLLGTLVTTKVITKIDQAKEITTKSNLKSYHTQINQFRMDTGRYPTEQEGLWALIEQPSDVTNYPDGGYLDSTEVNKDGWGRDFIYETYPGSNPAFLIRSCGPDGEPDTEDDLLSTDPD